MDNIVIQGEFCGGGIQGNPLKLIKPEWYVFNISNYDTRKRWSLDEMLTFCDEAGLTHVPIEERGESFDYDSVDNLLARASGRYDSGVIKEGIVVRPITSIYSTTLQAPLSMKVINNDYLLKKHTKR